MADTEKKKKIKLPINFKSKNPFNLIFWIMLLLLIIGEGWIIKNSVQVVLGSLKVPLIDVAKTQGVRIDFRAYNNVVNRIKAPNDYKPSDKVLINPFGVQNVSPN